MYLLKTLNKGMYLLVGLLLLITGCADLSVSNENSPTTEQVLKSPEDIESLVKTGFTSWWQAGADTYVLGVRVGQDIRTASWGNFDMLNRGKEPRIAYDNSPTASGDSKAMTERPWYGFYGVLSQANDFLTQLSEESLVLPSQEDGVSDENYTKMVEASAYLLQGLALGDLGLYFDKAFIFDETTTEDEILGLEFSTYQEVLAAADAKLKKAYDTAQNLGGVTLGDGYISGFDNMSMNTEFLQLINSLRARYMVLGARNGTENSNTDWANVKSMASDGLTYDFSPEGDDEFWFSYVLLYGNLSLWQRVDQRIIALMDPSQPSRYPTDGSSLGEASSDDKRLTTDFLYQSSIQFNPGRGLYFFSHYMGQRYSNHTFTFAGGPMPHILKAENDLMFAEAVVRTNDAPNYAAAADAINNTRVGRGELSPITAADFGTGTALEAIIYERTIELYDSGFGYGMGDQRRLENQQPGSMRQYPVPAKELLILQEELYTLGGATSETNSKARQELFNKFKPHSMDDVRQETNH